MMKKMLLLAFVGLFSMYKAESKAQIRTAQEAIKMYSITAKEDSAKVRLALEEWSNNNKSNAIPYLFLSDYHIIQNVILLQDYKNMFDEEQELLFEKRVTLVENYLADAKIYAPKSLDVQLSTLYAAYMILPQERYEETLLQIIQFNRDNNFDWQVENPYQIPIDYHTILDEEGSKATGEQKFLYWFFIWGQNNLKGAEFIPFERTEKIINFTANVLLQEYNKSLHVHMLLFHLYKQLKKEDIALSILQKAVEYHPDDLMLKVVFAVESYNSLLAYETVFPFRLKANEELAIVIKNSSDEALVKRAKEVKALLFSDKE